MEEAGCVYTAGGDPLSSPEFLQEQEPSETIPTTYRIAKNRKRNFFGKNRSLPWIELCSEYTVETSIKTILPALKCTL
jgi:hypothetical protein